MGIVRVGVHRGLVRPTVDDVEGVAIRDLLIEIIVKTALLETGGFNELQKQLPNPLPIRRLATQLTDDVTLFGLLAFHACSF
jgi:hypothetical protein